MFGHRKPRNLKKFQVRIVSLPSLTLGVEVFVRCTRKLKTTLQTVRLTTGLFIHMTDRADNIMNKHRRSDQIMLMRVQLLSQMKSRNVCVDHPARVELRRANSRCCNFPLQR